VKDEAKGDAAEPAPKPRKLEVHWAPSEEDKIRDEDEEEEDKSLGMDGGVVDRPEPMVSSVDKSKAPFPLLEKGSLKSRLRGIRRPDGKKVKETLSSWIQASRPSYFIVDLLPLFLALIVANRQPGHSSPGLFIMIAIACLLVHTAANFCNDYFEAQEVDAREKGSIGGSRVLQEGKITLQQLKGGIVACYFIALILAVFIAGKSTALWLMTLIGAFSSFFYTAPPIKYGHRALGEAMVFINMGVVMTVGTFMALTGSAGKDIWALSIPPAFMVAGILFFQSLPEIDKDREAGKVTLAGLLGKEGSSLVFLLWWPFVWLLVINLFLTGHLGAPSLLCLLAAPVHAAAVKRVRRAADWLELDKTGWMVKVSYAVTAIAILLGACLKHPS
jgi:1,4-dihydroxy-2-naphthoate octaprenyltransferase